MQALAISFFPPDEKWGLDLSTHLSAFKGGMGVGWGRRRSRSSRSFLPLSSLSVIKFHGSWPKGGKEKKDKRGSQPFSFRRQPLMWLCRRQKPTSVCRSKVPISPRPPPLRKKVFPKVVENPPPVLKPFQGLSSSSSLVEGGRGWQERGKRPGPLDASVQRTTGRRKKKVIST